MSTSHPDILKLLEGEPGGAAQAREHLRGCEACQRAYQAMVHAERQLSHGDIDAPSRPELDRLLKTVLSNTAVQQTARPKTSVWRLLLWGMPAVAAVAGVLFFVLPSEQEFQHRGVSPDKIDGVRAFCHAKETVTFATQQGLKCPAQGTLVVAVYLASRQRARAHVWLEEEGGRLLQSAGALPAGETVERAPKEQVLSSAIGLADVAGQSATLWVALCGDCSLDQAQKSATGDGDIAVHRIAVAIDRSGP